MSEPTEVIEDLVDRSRQYAPDPVGITPQSSPSTHRTTTVGGAFPEIYHTITHPVSHKLSPEEVAAYERDPTTMVGRMFLPGDGENLWEVVEVSFAKVVEKTVTKKKWHWVTVQIEGNPEVHKILLEEFLGMFVSGVLKAADY